MPRRTLLLPRITTEVTDMMTIQTDTGFRHDAILCAVLPYEPDVVSIRLRDESLSMLDIVTAFHGCRTIEVCVEHTTDVYSTIRGPFSIHDVTDRGGEFDIHLRILEEPSGSDTETADDATDTETAEDPTDTETASTATTATEQTEKGA